MPEAEVTSPYAPELEAFVQRQLDEGPYQTERELITAALKVYRDLMARHDSFRKDVERSVAQADAGETKELDFEEIKARITKRLAEKGITE